MVVLIMFFFLFYKMAAEVDTPRTRGGGGIGLTNAASYLPWMARSSSVRRDEANASPTGLAYQIWVV